MTQEATYCAYCGTDLVDAATVTRRFGEPFCSAEHADAFVIEVRAARVEGTAPSAESSEGDTRAEQAGDSLQRSATGAWSLGRLLKVAVCCAAPLLALVFLAGGGGALLGGGAAVLPYLALLACPLGMFLMMFMMRGKQHHGQGQKDVRNDSASGSDHPMER